MGKLTGKRIADTIFSYAYKEYLKGVKEGKHYIFDLETGVPYEVSEEEYKRYQERLSWFNNLKPKKKKGIMILTGTGGDVENTNTFKDMFYNPESYTFIPWKEDQ